MRAHRLSKTLGFVLGAGLVLGALVAVPAYADTSQSAVPTAPNVYLACGYDLHQAPTTCRSLPVVLADALSAENNTASTPTAVIRLLPGHYCPIDLAPPGGGTLYRNVTLSGAGPAVEGGGAAALDRPEAALSTFAWGNVACGTVAPAAMIAATHGSTMFSHVRLHNLAVDGSAADGPQRGIYSTGNLLVTDVIAQNMTNGSGIGLDWMQADNTSMQVRGSFFAGNAVGIRGNGHYSVTDSTIVDNTAAGIQNDFGGTLINDTIMGNGTGISSAGAIAAANSIVLNNPAGANSANCAGIGWESNDPAVGTSGNNLVDGDSCRTKQYYDPGASNPDLVPSAPVTSMNPLTNLYGPTPTPLLAPPTDAIGAGEPGWCQRPDQREQVRAVDSCDIGALDTSADVPAAADVSGGGDLGEILVGETAASLVSLSASNRTVYVGSVSVAGDTDEIRLADDGDGCSKAALVVGTWWDGRRCDVMLELGSATPGTYQATVSIQTSEGVSQTPITLTVADIATPPAATAFTWSGAARTSTTYGAATTVSARLTAGSDPVASAPVALCHRQVGAGAFGGCVAATTDAQGRASRQVAPSSSREYRWTFTGDTEHLASTSVAHVVGVRPKLALRASAAKAKARSVVKLTVRSLPGLSGVRVVLQRQVSGRWTDQPGRLVLTKGSATFKVRKTTTGHYTYRVRTVATSNYDATVSGPARFRVVR